MPASSTAATPYPPPSLAHRFSRTLLVLEWAVILVPLSVVAALAFAWFGGIGAMASSVVGWHGSLEKAAPLLALTGGAAVLALAWFGYVALVTALAWAYAITGRRALRAATWATWVGLALVVAFALRWVAPVTGSTPLLVVLLPALHLLAARLVMLVHDLRAGRAAA